MLSFAHLDACRVNFLSEDAVKCSAFAQHIHSYFGLACYRNAGGGPLLVTGTHHLTAEASVSWPGSVYRSRSVTLSPSGCNRWSTPRHHSTSRRIQNHRVPPVIPPRPRNIKRIELSDVDHCNSSWLVSPAHVYQTQNRRARTYNSGHQDQIDLEVSDVRGMTNPQCFSKVDMAPQAGRSPLTPGTPADDWYPLFP